MLIVEDEKVSRRALAALLVASGYATNAVASGEEALDVIRHGDLPDIALIDLDLPGMDGVDLINQIRECGRPVQTVLITAASAERLSQRLKDRGLAYLPKPLDFDRLLSVLGDDRPHAQPAPSAHN